ncbi:MAG: flagellar basal body P-ring protein FlgI [Rhodospirillales bacterium]|nr:flagellar basal body P-ring protein FlgI [Rhodospirillales bacterium]
MTNLKTIVICVLVGALVAQAPPAAADAARVVIDQRTGAVVMTGEVRVGRVAVTAGGLTVRTTEAPVVSQPGPFARSGKTVVVPRTRVQVDEGRGKVGRLVVIEENASLDELVARLNRLRLSPGELIQVLQAIKAAGALQAEIVVK